MTVIVALPLPIDQLFSYRISNIDNHVDLVGSRVLVPLGNRALTGIIVEQQVQDTRNDIKEILELLDNVPSITHEMLEFTKWMADYYLCTWGEALRSAIPQAMSPKSKVKVHLIRLPDKDEIETLRNIAPKRAELLDFISKSNNELSLGYLQAKLKMSAIAPKLEVLKNEGYIEYSIDYDKDAKPKKAKAIIPSAKMLKDGKFAKYHFDELDRKAPKQSLALGKIISLYLELHEPILLSDAVKTLGATSSSISALIEKGLLNQLEIELDRNSHLFGNKRIDNRNEKFIRLNEEQIACIDSIKVAITNGIYKSFLLYGVTGSGKTLVYVHAIIHCLEQGKSALYLVPEISLTPQLIDRLEAFFPNMTVVHSKMSEGEKFDAWRRIKNGDSKVVIGTRSALFAPIDELGLIIVDEEHDRSYKQDSPNPRYHGRDSAIMRARMNSAVIVLGSATPSIESLYNTQISKYELLDLPKRADSALMPEVKIIDMRTANLTNQSVHGISLDLITEIESTISKKEGVILFQNRRGYSSFLVCEECGSVPTCQNCDITLTYHKSINKLKCHYCGYQELSKTHCSQCGALEIKEYGSGTQKIEDLLGTYLEDRGISAVIDRIDLDTTSRKGEFRKKLFGFARGDTDILIGTQMLTKGLDIGRVTLVGVINADQQLLIPDFRSFERTAQLISQVAGRAGRKKDLPGKVIIQTRSPELIAIQIAKTGDYLNFFSQEINTRREGKYPPFTRFNLIEFYGMDKQLVAEQASRFASLLPKETSELLVYGPNEPSVAKLRNNYRMHIIVKSSKKQDPNGIILKKYLLNAKREYSQKFQNSKVKMTIDIDSHQTL